MADEKDLRILNVSFSHGSVHDFKLFSKNCVHFLKDALLIADKEYIGMNKIHSNSLIPKKSTKRNKLKIRFNYFKAENLHRACEQAYQEIQNNVLHVAETREENFL